MATTTNETGEALTPAQMAERTGVSIDYKISFYRAAQPTAPSATTKEVTS